MPIDLAFALSGVFSAPGLPDFVLGGGALDRCSHVLLDRLYRNTEFVVEQDGDQGQVVVPQSGVLVLGGVMISFRHGER